MKRFLISFSLLFPLVVVSLAVAAGKPAATQQKSSAPAAPPAGVAKAKNSDPTTGMEFVAVKGGCYQMGDSSGDGRKFEKPVHEVCVADFNIGKYEVTQEQWEKVMGTSLQKNECGPNCPVTFVSWDMAQEFIRSLNNKSGKQYRLPTEAEWEYAARSGGKNEKWAGTSDEAKLADFAWYDRNSQENLIRTVGKKKPNGLGIYDMSGNAQELCLDWYDEGYYGVSSKDNPSGPASGKKRVVRGGSFGSTNEKVKTTARYRDNPDISESSTGFRLLLPAK